VPGFLKTGDRWAQKIVIVQKSQAAQPAVGGPTRGPACKTSTGAHAVIALLDDFSKIANN
jgi:hypothetical protein